MSVLFSDTYELALKAEKEAVATSESEVELSSAKRKIHRNKFRDYVTHPEPPKLVISTKNSGN